jgi:COMPASS component SWD2
MHPTEDHFASGSQDGDVRFWDLRSNVCQGRLNSSGSDLVRGRPCVAYDPQGLIVAVACAVNHVKLFDLRSFDKVMELVGDV